MSFSEHRMIVERRLQRDRRRGLDRRIGERRLQAIAVAAERRGGTERRLGIRRSPMPRRGWIDRRGQGTSDPFTLVTPE